METLLEYFQRYYDFFEKFNGNLSYYKFNEKVEKTIDFIMQRANQFYNESKKNPNLTFSLHKDDEGKVYLKINGKDDLTILIVVQNDANLQNYKLPGKKITESGFEKFFEYLERSEISKLAHQLADISSRYSIYVNESLDLKKEFEVQKLKEYYEYLNEYNSKKDSDHVEVIPGMLISLPENKTQRNNDSSTVYNGPLERKNEIIDYEQRRRLLLKYNPFASHDILTDKETCFYAFYYLVNDQVIAIIEPEKGDEYTRVLNLGFYDENNMEQYKYMVKAALESSRDIQGIDPAIIRKSHTTLDAFEKNLEDIFNVANNSYRFSNDLLSASSVYMKK